MRISILTSRLVDSSSFEIEATTLSYMLVPGSATILKSLKQHYPATAFNRVFPSIDVVLVTSDSS